MSGRAQRARRTTITFEMKLDFLKLAVQHNPYEESQIDTWKAIIDNMQEKHGIQFQRTTLSKLLSRYLKDYKADQLKFKTGTEEKQTEMKELLEALLGQEDASKIVPDPLSDIYDEEDVLLELVTDTDGQPTPTSTKKEKEKANAERDKAVNSNIAPEPNPSRGIRTVSAVDQLIKMKQEQDYELEQKRIRLDETKSVQQFELEQRRLDMEARRIKLQEEENKRKDELQASQIELQRTLLQVMEAMLKK